MLQNTSGGTISVIFLRNSRCSVKNILKIYWSHYFATSPVKARKRKGDWMGGEKERRKIKNIEIHKNKKI